MKKLIDVLRIIGYDRDDLIVVGNDIANIECSKAVSYLNNYLPCDITLREASVWLALIYWMNGNTRTYNSVKYSVQRACTAGASFASKKNINRGGTHNGWCINKEAFKKIMIDVECCNSDVVEDMNDETQYSSVIDIDISSSTSDDTSNIKVKDPRNSQTQGSVTVTMGDCEDDESTAWIVMIPGANPRIYGIFEEHDDAVSKANEINAILAYAGFNVNMLVQQAVWIDSDDIVNEQTDALKARTVYSQTFGSVRVIDLDEITVVSLADITRIMKYERTRYLIKKVLNNEIYRLSTVTARGVCQMSYVNSNGVVEIFDQCRKVHITSPDTGVKYTVSDFKAWLLGNLKNC